jgi:hypothetical protein
MTTALGTVGTSRTVELFKRSLMMKPANKAISATKLIAKGARHDRRLVVSIDRPAGTTGLEADAAFVSAPDGANAQARSVGIAASRASSSSSALANRSAGKTARHFCTICSI